MRDLHRGHAIDGRLLDCGVRYPGIRGLRSVPGEFPGHEELARAQERRAREPMAHEATHLRPVAQFVPAVPADPHDAHVLASAQRSGAVGRAAHPTHAEGPDADEYPGGERVERYERGHRTSHPHGHSCWTTQA